MEELYKDFQASKEAYQELISKDFPDFDIDEYIEQKHREAEHAGIEPEIRIVEDTGEEQPEGKRRKFGKKIVSKLDFSGDGKLGINDLTDAAKKTGRAATSAAKDAGQSIKNLDVSEIKSSAQNLIVGAGDTIGNADVSGITGAAARISKSATGVQGFQNRKAAKNIEKVCSEYYELAEEITEEKRRKLNYAITDFGEYRLQVLHLTVGRFLDYLKELKQNNVAKEYEILMGTEFSFDKLAEMERLDMVASEALRSTAVAGAFGLAALAGTPTAVTGAVGAFAAASTGTTISTLSGAAATNATLAWLGGGSLAAGGGGMAAGATVLATITASATGAAAILAAGTIVSVHYGKKLTEAKEYEKEVGIAVAGLEKGWVVMDGIGKRTAELREVTEELKWRTINQLDSLEKIISDFDFQNPGHVSVFTKCGVLIKTMVTLAQTPLLDEDGNLSYESMKISGKVRSVLNTEV
ncbi:MAG: hypothetical protein GX898_02140 [Corynebacterium sp.]|nr:hypothetical protein [Corynebacterium sp.]